MLRMIVIGVAGILLAGCATEASPPRQAYDNDPQAILERTWQWEATTTPVAKISVDAPERFTLRLGGDGRAQIRFDCNMGGGGFEIAPGRLTFGPLISTRMACPPGSLDGIFMRDLERVASFFVKEDRLYLELPYDSGTMQFRPGE